MVTDGSREEPYLSGFHAYPSLKAVQQWLRGAKNLDNRVVVKVWIEGCIPKPRAVRHTFLAKRMFIYPQAWTKRKNAKSMKGQHG